MLLLRPASEDDMVAIFLAAEVTSEGYGPQIRGILTRLGQPRGIVEQPDTRDEAANAVRRQVLAAYRDYPAGDVFTGMAADGARRLGPWLHMQPGTIYRQIAENLRDGQLPPALILLGEPGLANLVVIEGHKRLTGLLLCPQWLPAELDVQIGRA